MSKGRRAFCLVAASAILFRVAPAGADTFVLIRSASNDVSAISKDELYKLYTGESKQLGSFVAQTVIGQEESAEFSWLASLFDMPPKYLLTKIKQQVFRGEMRRPIVAKSAEEAVSAVRNHRGGLAVLAASVAKSLPDDVAVVALQ